jgi:hypothetical protein
MSPKELTRAILDLGKAVAGLHALFTGSHVPPLP